MLRIMRVIRLLGLTLLLLAGLAAQKRPITHEDVWLMKRTGAPVLSPDGKQVAFVLTEPDYDPNKQSADIWLAPADGSAPPRRLTATRGAESGLTWSPDSRLLAFTARREGDEAPQVYVLPMDGGEAYRLTTLSTGASSPKFSPDGKRILFESMVYRGAPDDAANQARAAEVKGRKWSARIYDHFPIRYWNAWLDERVAHVFVQDLDPKATARDILAGTQLAELPGFSGVPNPVAGGQTLSAEWSPDGEQIVFIAVTNLHRAMSEEVESHLYRIPVKGGEQMQLTSTGASYFSPVFSPDGQALYALQQKSPEPGKRIYSLSRLVRVPFPRPGEPEALTAKWDRSVGGVAFLQKGRSLVLQAEDDGFDRVFRMPAAADVPQVALDPKLGGYAAVQCEADVCVAHYGGSHLPNEIVRLDLAARSHKLLTDFNRARLESLDLPAPEHFWFQARNGRRIHSIIYFPPALDRGKKYPLVVFPHGGPNSMSKDSWSTRWNSQYLTTPGYVLLQTNYTGSTGFGEKFADDIERDVLRGPAKELLEAIEEAARRYPFIDLSRQAAIGASYGGYLMNWFNGHTNQFRCMVNHAGAVNNESQYGVNDGGLARELRMGAPIWDFGKGQWNDQSPIRYASKWSTPMLITQGELDFRVPFSESFTTFKILQRRGVPTRFVVYPDEGHWILKGENSRKHMEEVLSWLKKYLDPATPVWKAGLNE